MSDQRALAKTVRIVDTAWVDIRKRSSQAGAAREVAATAAALPRLAALVSGLLFVSESDHPLSVVRLGLATETELPSALPAAASRVGAAVQRVPLEIFFERATQVQPYHTAEDRAVVARYQALVQFLVNDLAGARVYRVGEIEVDVYAIGQSLEGEWLGVATKLIET